MGMAILPVPESYQPGTKLSAKPTHSRSAQSTFVS